MKLDDALGREVIALVGGIPLTVRLAARVLVEDARRPSPTPSGGRARSTACARVRARLPLPAHPRPRDRDAAGRDDDLRRLRGRRSRCGACRARRAHASRRYPCRGVTGRAGRGACVRGRVRRGPTTGPAPRGAPCAGDSRCGSTIRTLSGVFTSVRSRSTPWFLATSCALELAVPSAGPRRLSGGVRRGDLPRWAPPRNCRALAAQVRVAAGRPRRGRGGRRRQGGGARPARRRGRRRAPWPGSRTPRSRRKRCGRSAAGPSRTGSSRAWPRPRATSRLRLRRPRPDLAASLSRRPDAVSGRRASAGRLLAARHGRELADAALRDAGDDAAPGNLELRLELLLNRINLRERMGLEYRGHGAADGPEVSIAVAARRPARGVGHDGVPAAVWPPPWAARAGAIYDAVRASGSATRRTRCASRRSCAAPSPAGTRRSGAGGLARRADLRLGRRPGRDPACLGRLAGLGIDAGLLLDRVLRESAAAEVREALRQIYVWWRSCRGPVPTAAAARPWPPRRRTDRRPPADSSTLSRSTGPAGGPAARGDRPDGIPVEVPRALSIASATGTTSTGFLGQTGRRFIASCWAASRSGLLDELVEAMLATRRLSIRPALRSAARRRVSKRMASDRAGIGLAGSAPARGADQGGPGSATVPAARIRAGGVLIRYCFAFQVTLPSRTCRSRRRRRRDRSP